MFRKAVVFMFLSFSLLLGACASRTSDALAEKKIEPHYQPMHQINSTKIFAADSKNANYSDEENRGDIVADLPDVVRTEPVIRVENEAEKNIPIVIENKMPDIRKTQNMMVAMILFESGSFEVDKKYNNELKNVAKTAEEKNARVLVYGYASSKTKNEDFESQKMINYKMSLKRAQSVAEALKKAGVKKENIIVEAFGDAMPLFSDSMIEGEKLNRRTEVYLVY